jgi:hypothetical protein
MKALSVGNTWLFEAETAVDIVQTYGEGGAHPSQLLIDKIKFARGEPEGSTKLLGWLRDWQASHPV